MRAVSQSVSVVVSYLRGFNAVLQLPMRRGRLCQVRNNKVDPSHLSDTLLSQGSAELITTCAAGVLFPLLVYDLG